jgi:hypothetical protein
VVTVAEKARIKVAAVGGWLRAVAEAATEHGTAALPAVVAVAAGKALPAVVAVMARIKYFPAA